MVSSGFETGLGSCQGSGQLLCSLCEPMLLSSPFAEVELQANSALIGGTVDACTRDGGARRVEQVPGVLDCEDSRRGQQSRQGHGLWLASCARSWPGCKKGRALYSLETDPVMGLGPHRGAGQCLVQCVHR